MSLEVVESADKSMLLKSSFLRAEQPLNIQLTSVAFSLVNQLERLRVLSALQPWNIQLKLLTDEVLKLDRSSDVKLSQRWNIWLIVVTFDVLKNGHQIDVNEVQTENICFMFVVFDVLKLLNTISSIPEQL